MKWLLLALALVVIPVGLTLLIHPAYG